MSARDNSLSTLVSNEPVRLAVLGCGRIAQSVHLPTLRSISSVQVVALAEPDAALRDKAQRRFPQADAFSDWQEVLELPNVDAVVIALPNALHAETAIAAFESGKHVYLEKPIALNLDSVSRVLNAWQQSGCQGAIGFNYRYHPLIRELKNSIQKNQIGKISAVRSRFCTASQAIPAWKKDLQSGGGVLLDLATHHIDLMRFLFDSEIIEARAKTFSEQHEGDNATLEMELESGLKIQSFFSSSAPNEDSIEVIGEKGKLSFNRHKSLVLEREDGRLRRWYRIANNFNYSLRKLRSPNYEPSYRIALAHFANCIQSGEEYSPNLNDGFASLKVVLNAAEAARKNNNENSLRA